MALIQMILLDASIAKHLEHLKTTDTKDQFLGHTMVMVAAVESTGDCAVIVAVARDISIKIDDRDLKTSTADKTIDPALDNHVTATDRDDDLLRKRLKKSFLVPDLRMLGLIAILIKLLAEETILKQQSDCYCRDMKVCAGLESITSKDTKTTCIIRDTRIMAYLHRKIGNLTVFSPDTIGHRRIMEI